MNDEPDSFIEYLPIQDLQRIPILGRGSKHVCTGKCAVMAVIVFWFPDTANAFVDTGVLGALYQTPEGVVSMTTYLDIQRAVDELIKQHGADAPIHTSIRADEMLKAGDPNRKAVQTLVEEHLGAKQNQRLLIWSLLCVEEWCHAFPGVAAKGARRGVAS